MNAEGINNVFVIPYARKSYIVYLPLHGILFNANSAAVNLFRRALAGDEIARRKFGFSKELVAGINKDLTFQHHESNEQIRFKPTMVSLFLTTDCSMKCGYCYASGGDKRSNIKMEYVEAAANEIIKNALDQKKPNITVNYHGGGDVGVVWNLLEEITAYINGRAQENNLTVTYSAGLNGILSDYQRKWIVDNIHSVTVSLDGDEEIQNKLRPLMNGLPSFSLVHKTLKYFDAHKLNYAIRSTITSESVKHLERIITFICTNYEVKLIKTEPVYIQGRASFTDVAMPDANEFIDNFLKAKKIADSYGKQLLYSGARFNVLTDSFCKATGGSFGVTPEGYISSCYEVLDKEDPKSEIFFYGQIRKNKIDIDQIKLDGLQSFIVTNKGKCEKCFAKYHCAGDCPVKSVLSASTTDTDNYRCTINRELTKQQLLEAIEQEQ